MDGFSQLETEALVNPLKDGWHYFTQGPCSFLLAKGESCNICPLAIDYAGCF
jgi:hypothetical protein